MRIGIDIDDTAFVMVDSALKYADIYDLEIGGSGRTNDVGLIKNNHYLQELYDWDDKAKFAFFDKYYKNILEEEEMSPNFSEVINKLKSEGNEIYFISARLTNIKDCDSLKITKDSFNRYNIPYDKLIINTPDKLAACIENKIDLYVDDSYETCKKLINNGIKAYLKTSPINKNIKDDEIVRIDDWIEFYELLKK